MCLFYVTSSIDAGHKMPSPYILDDLILILLIIKCEICINIKSIEVNFTTYLNLTSIMQIIEMNTR